MSVDELDDIEAKIANGGTLDPADLDTLAKLSKSSTDRHTLLGIFYCYRRLGGTVNIPLIEPHLDNENPMVASFALWTLCWLGQSLRLKPYMLEAIDTGFARDPDRKIGQLALRGAGHHLRTHRDRDFAQMLIRWAPPHEWDDLRHRKLPAGLEWVDFRSCVSSAGHAIGNAMGANPADLLGNEPLIADLVRRFIADRQDG